MARLRAIEQDANSSVCVDVSGLRLTDQQFYRLCGDNPELRFELTAGGELIIMPPTFSGTGWRESEIIRQLATWTRADGTGLCFGSSTGFKLPNGAKRSPDASWMPLSRWRQLTEGQRERQFAPVCPDFVIELRSPTDRVSTLKKKMTEYMQNGARLGWLLDPLKGIACIYRPGLDPECLESPEYLDGENVLSGFRFSFREILQV